ncbi:hypothetical protein EVAR_32567_1 [Eumeta japonica]|uniref:Uncharacterized protein n=1 Tax=Eumeta variegata TaxID=151549 RepID=A0A4C1VTG8_EUMVA|nr:hypothetical protein EVAR_32567_1 [Eumeta japonica]
MQEIVPRNKVTCTCRPRSKPTPRLSASSRSSAATRDIYTRVELNYGADACPARSRHAVASPLESRALSQHARSRTGRNGHCKSKLQFRSKSKLQFWIHQKTNAIT